VPLNGLARGHVAKAARVLVGQVSDDAQLLRVHHAAGQFDPHHEVAVVGPLLIDAVPAHPGKIVRVNAFVAVLGVAQHVGPNVEAIFFLFEQFDLLSLVALAVAVVVGAAI
jgi:hypothetical protein